MNSVPEGTAYITRINWFNWMLV